MVINFNGQEVMGNSFGEAFKSLLETTYNDCEIIFVDNGSTDASLRTAGSLSKGDSRVKFVECKRNLGIAGAVKRAYSSVSPDSVYLGILNNDVVFEADWLVGLVEVLESNQDLACAYPLVFDNYTNKAFVGGTMDIMGFFHVINAEIDSFSSPALTKFGRTAYLGGTAMVIRKEDYERVGGLDDSFFLYYEEVDLAWRLLLSGKVNALVVSSKAHHLRGVTAARLSENARSYFANKNRLVMTLKNHDLQYVVPTFVGSLIITIGYYLLVRRDARKALTYIRACYASLERLPSIAASRGEIKRYRKLATRNLVSLGLISPLRLSTFQGHFDS